MFNFSDGEIKMQLLIKVDEAPTPSVGSDFLFCTQLIEGGLSYRHTLTHTAANVHHVKRHMRHLSFPHPLPLCPYPAVVKVMKMNNTFAVQDCGVEG